MIEETEHEQVTSGFARMLQNQRLIDRAVALIELAGADQILATIRDNVWYEGTISQVQATSEYIYPFLPLTGRTLESSPFLEVEALSSPNRMSPRILLKPRASLLDIVVRLSADGLVLVVRDGGIIDVAAARQASFSSIQEFLREHQLTELFCQIGALKPQVNQRKIKIEQGGLADQVAEAVSDLMKFREQRSAYPSQIREFLEGLTEGIPGGRLEAGSRFFNDHDLQSWQQQLNGPIRRSKFWNFGRIK